MTRTERSWFSRRKAMATTAGRIARCGASAPAVLRYSVAIDGRVQRLAISVAWGLQASDVARVQNFARTTAWLQHVGVLPPNCANALE